MKANILLSNGTKVEVESNDVFGAGEIARLVLNLVEGTTGVKKSEATVAGTNSVKQSIVNVKAPTSVKNIKYPKHTTPWSERDLVGIARVIKENLHQKKPLTPLAIKYLRSNGDVRNRTEMTMSSIVSGIKNYLRTGLIKYTNLRTVGILNKAGVFPVTVEASSSVSSYLPSLEDIKKGVVEA